VSVRLATTVATLICAKTADAWPQQGWPEGGRPPQFDRPQC